jgi:DNA primase
MNIVDLIQSDGFTLKKMASTSGGEYAGACPFGCGGVDRFRVWPNHNGGRYWCRGCGAHGDAISYLRFRGVSFKKACQLLGKNPRPAAALPPAAASASPAQSRKELTAVIDSARWSEQAANFQETFVDCLWSEQGESARAFLSGRGLNDSTIKAAGIGYNILDRFPNRSDFGLPEELNENGNQKKVWIPKGVVIPKIIDNQIVRLRVRRMEANVDPKYVLAAGSDTSPLVFPDRARRLAAVVIVESELDAALIAQQAGDLVTVVAMGSAQLKPDQKTEQLLNNAEIILVALDADDAGAKAAHKYWLPTYPNAKRWPVSVGKDASDAYQQGLDIRCWIEAGLTYEGEHRTFTGQ